MDLDQTIWRRMPRAAGAVALGFVVAAIFAYGLKLGAFWSASFGVLATAAIGLNPLGGRRNQSVAGAGESAQTLATFPSLAREVFENLPDPLMLLDRAGRVHFANAPMRAVVGSGAEGKHVSAILRTPSVLEAIQHATQTGQPSNVEFSFRV